MNKKRPEVTLYSRDRCPLCDDARELISELSKSYKFTFTETDIESCDQLTEDYGLKIPVVMVNNEEIQYGKIDYKTIERELLKNL